MVDLDPQMSLTYYVLGRNFHRLHEEYVEGLSLEEAEAIVTFHGRSKP